MKISGYAGAAVGLVLAGSVWAHTGATGVVKERMNGMVIMSFYVKDITQMMRGKETYDAERVRTFAENVAEHSGEAMTKLFPEGTTDHPSEAKANIWTDWEEFEDLANRLAVLAEGMKLASENGVAAGATDAMADGDTMMGNDTMMGTDTMMGGGAMMGATPMMADLKAADLAEMPVNEVFQMVSQTCAACHTKFRAEK